MTLLARNLCVARGARAVLHDIELSLTGGSVCAVVGPNGVGKSTLLAAFAGLLAPSHGTVELEGVAFARMSEPARARRIAFLPQTPETHWPVTVSTMVGLARLPFRGQTSAVEDAAAVEAALRRTGTLQWAERDVQTLSGGERARVMLARLIAGTPQWILADEPFAGLDPAHQFEAADLMRAMAQSGCGVVFTVHDLTLAARVTDRIVVLRAGRIAADGDPVATLTPALLREVYEIEARWISLEGRAGRFMVVQRRCDG